MLINTKDTNEILTRSEIIICDWDNVIQNIDIPWLVGVYQNKELFKDYFDEEKMDVTQKDYLFKVLGRKDYYLDQWLLKDKEKQLPQHLKELFMDIYIKDEDFYNKCKFTELSKTLSIMVHQNFCSELVFLSHAPSGMNGEDKRKEKIFEKYKEMYGLEDNNKVRLVIIDEGTKKHDWVKENCPNFTTAIDDRVDIIKGYISETDITKGVFIMPRLGYNSPIDDHLTNQEKIKYFLGYSNVIQYTSPF